MHLFVKPYLGRVHWEQCSRLPWTHSVTHSHLQAAQYNHSLICWPLSNSDKRWRSRALLKGPTVVVVMKEGQVLLSFLSPRFILLVWGYESPPLQSQARFSNLSATNALLICPSMTCLGRGFTWDTHEKTNFVTNWIWITCCQLLNSQRVVFFVEVYFRWVKLNLPNPNLQKYSPGLSWHSH